MTFGAVAVLLAIAAAPVASGLSATLVQAWDGPAWRQLLDYPGLADAVWLSAWTGVASTTLALAAAHALVAVTATRGGTHRLRLLSLPVLATPHLAIGIGLVLLLAPSGLVLRALSPWATGFTQPPDWATVQDPFGLALIIGLAAKEVPFLVVVLLAALHQVPAERRMTQARVLGYGPLKAWFAAVAPALHRQSRLAIAAVLVFGVTNVEMAMALGPTTPPTLSILLWQWFTDADLATRPLAFAGAVLLVMIAAGCLVVVSALSRLAARPWRQWATSGHRALDDAWVAQVLRLAGGSLLMLGLLSLVALLLRSVGGTWRFPALVPSWPSAAAWQELVQVSGGAALASLLLGLAASVLSVALVLAAAEGLHDRPAARRRVGAVLFVPLLLPQMAFLFGLQVMLLRLELAGTWFAVLWSHLVFTLPYAWALLAEARAQLPPGYRQVARTLGASRFTAWTTVVLPLLSRSVLLAVPLCFAISMALYLPTLFAGGGRIVTATTEAAVALGGGDQRFAAAHGALQALLPVSLLALCTLLSRRLFRHRQGVPA